jgi:tRNA-dihydrouridine synthase A
MLGRAAYHDPYVLAEADRRLFDANAVVRSREQVVRAMHDYARKEIAQGTPLRSIARHMLGLYHGQPRARLWRQMLSDAARLARNDAGLLLEALDATQSTSVEHATP